MKSPSHWKLIALLSVTFGALISGIILYSYRSAAEAQALALDVFERAFASKVVDRFGSPRLRIRSGNEIFCIQESAVVPVTVDQLILDLATAFDLDWKRIHVEDIAECPENTNFYVLHDKHPDQIKMTELLYEIVGSAPPDLDKKIPESALGYSVNLPGYRKRDFVFITVQEGMPDWVSHSIMSEELLQATLRASDVSYSTVRIVSLLVENAVSDDYSLWFEHNPSGFCSLDIILMELLLSPSLSHLKSMEELRNYLTTNYKELVNAAEVRGEALFNYADPRCWN